MIRKLFARLNAFLEVKFFFKNLLVPLALLTIYFLSFAFLAQRLVGEGVNSNFAARSGRYLLVGLGAVALVTLLLWITRKTERAAKPASAPRVPRWGDAILLILPLTSIVQYMLNNQAIISLQDGLITFLFFTLLAGMLILGIPALLGRFSSARVLMALGLAFVMTITNMAMLSSEFNWFNTGALKIQMGYFAAIFVLAWLVLGLPGRGYLAAVVLVYFAANTGLQLVTLRAAAEPTALSEDENQLSKLIGGRAPAQARNVYLLVYDAYVPSGILQNYAIDNHTQEEYLQAAGFALYPQVYTVGDSTVSSMSRVLNASTQYFGTRRRAVSGDGVVQRAFKQLGYTTYGVFSSDYMFRGIGSTYDHSIPEGVVNTSSNLLITGIISGEFRYNLGFDQQTHPQYVGAKQAVFRSIPTTPIFVYAHSSLPGHSQTSGACLKDETAGYQSRLEEANNEMRQDIATLLESDPDAIIIIAGDHGPYLTKNCTKTAGAYRTSEIARVDIQDRYGTFLAVRWPTKDFHRYDQINVLQDVFPAVFAYLYQDEEFLDLKIVPETLDTDAISGVSVMDGIIHGGMDDGEPLFEPQP